jgi:actin-like ATPase involved in cell morphogenesis
MENIKISCGKSSEGLDSFDKEIIERISQEYILKIRRHFENIDSFEIYVKCYLKKGNVKRYRINSKLIVPGFRFEASADEWKIQDAVHKALEKIMNEIEHKMHISNQGNKSRAPQNFRIRKR